MTIAFKSTATLLALLLAITAQAQIPQTVKPAGSFADSLPKLAGYALPHVANNAILAGSTFYAFRGAIVVRDGFAAPGDGGVATYTYTKPACSISGGDGGTQIPADVGGCWIVDPSAPITIELFAGAIGVQKDFIPKVDAQPALQRALNTGKTVTLGPLAYYVKRQSTITTPGQTLRGQGRWATRLEYGADFSLSNGSSVIGLNGVTNGNEGPDIHDFMIKGFQPEVDSALSVSAQLASLVPVSCLDLRNVIASKVEHMMITTCLRGIDLRGQTGQSVLDDIQGSNFIATVDIDGALDTIRISNLHDFPESVTPNQAKLVQINAAAIQSGRMDDLNISNGLFIASHTGIKLIVGTRRTLAADGYASPGGVTKGSAVDSDFDGMPLGFQEEGGGFSLTGGYFASVQDIVLNGGSLVVSNMSTSVNRDGLVTMNNQSFLTLNGLQWGDANSDFTPVIQNGGVLVFNNNLYVWNGRGDTTKPKIHTICCRLVATGNLITDFGSGTKTGNSSFFQVDANNFAQLGQNLMPGWTDIIAGPTVTASAGTATPAAGYSNASGSIVGSAAATITVKFTNSSDKAPTCVVGSPNGPQPTWSTMAGGLGTTALVIITHAAETVSYVCGGQGAN